MTAAVGRLHLHIWIAPHSRTPRLPAGPDGTEIERHHRREARLTDAARDRDRWAMLTNPNFR